MSTPDRICIDAYNVIDLLKEVQQYILNGYTFDFHSNENSPQLFGTRYVVPMVRQEKEPVNIGELQVKVAVDAEQAQKVQQELQEAAQEAQAQGVTEGKAEMPEVTVEVVEQPAKGKPGRKPAGK